MKRIILSILMFLMIVSNAYGDPWKLRKAPRWSCTYGGAFAVVDVRVVSELEINGKIFYRYKIILRRLPNEVKTKGLGVIRIPGGIARVKYWASSINRNVVDDIKSNLITKEKWSADNYVVLYPYEGFSPSIIPHKIKVGVFLYPFSSGPDVKKSFSQKYIYGYVSLYRKLINACPQFKENLWSSDSSSLDEVLNNYVKFYGGLVEIETYAKLPIIKGLSVEKAFAELVKRNLKPVLDGYVKTDNPALDNIVVGYSRTVPVRERNRVRAGTKMYFSVFKYNCASCVPFSPHHTHIKGLFRTVFPPVRGIFILWLRVI